MQKKYKIRKDLKLNYKGKTLYRIEALRDVEGCKVKKGDLGGWIECEENLSQGGSCWIYDEAKAYENCYICEQARVLDRAEVFGEALVYDKACISGDAKVYDCGRVGEKAWVHGNAQVFEDARVLQEVHVGDNAKIYKNSFLFGCMDICGNTEICLNDKYNMAIRDCYKIADDKIDNLTQICFLFLDGNNITITNKHIIMQGISYKKEEWFNFNEEEIKNIFLKKDIESLNFEFWKKWKPILKGICEKNN